MLLLCCLLYCIRYFSFISTKLRRTSPKWPVLCQVRHKALTQSTNQPINLIQSINRYRPTFSLVDVCAYHLIRRIIEYTTPSPKTYLLWLAIILTYTIRLWQILAKVLLRKQEIRWCFVFPLHLSSRFALPCETGNPEIAFFNLKILCCFCQQTHEAHSNYHLVAVESSFIPKVIDCMHQTKPT